VLGDSGNKRKRGPHGLGLLEYFYPVSEADSKVVVVG